MFSQKLNFYAEKLDSFRNFPIGGKLVPVSRKEL
jgi:hypothetical protein